MQSLRQSKGKFLSKLRTTNLEEQSGLTVEQKMERLIDQAELLAGFLLNKYQDSDMVRPKSAKKDRARGSSSKRSRGKKSRKKKIIQGNVRFDTIWLSGFKMRRERVFGRRSLSEAAD